MILVTGAAGKVGSVGRKIAELLRERHEPVRAFVRQRDERSAHLERLGAEIVCGDLTEVADAHRALDGCDRAYFGISVSPAYLEAAVDFAAVARHYPMRALVNISQMTVSQMSARETTDSRQQKMHWLVEQALNWSGLPVTHIRATVFLEHFFFYAWARDSIRRDSEIRLPFGDARTSPVASLDVARVVARILADPAGHVGRVYELTGPVSAGMTEHAAAYSRALGREIRYRDLPFDEWLRSVPLGELPPHVANHIETMARLHRDNRYDRRSDGVRAITGQEPLSVERWVSMNRDFFLNP